MHIFREKAGVIAEGRVWVCFHKEYMYLDTHFAGLLWQIYSGWKKDKNFIGF